MPEWIQDRLPELKLSMARRYGWRSDLVLIYHELYGRHTATLCATEGKINMWWKLRMLWTYEKEFALNDILGWLPLDTLPDRPPSNPIWFK